MPEFWEFPTVSMGLGPLAAIYQARFNRYLQHRGIKDTSNNRVWAFLGDGETDEPEALGSLSIAAREGLDNLTFVVNCNLQRLDGPVRGNGKIIQELESVFRGAGWNVIKVIWGREWDELLARDIDGVLVHKMQRHPRRRVPEVLASRAAPTSASTSSALTSGCRDLVANMSDDEICQAAPRRPRLPQGLRGLRCRDEDARPTDGHPGQDGQGLDARAGRRGTQHHPPGQEADRAGAQGLPRPA